MDFSWTDEMQTACDKMRLLVAADADALSVFPDNSKCIDVYTDFSDYHMGPCIMQYGCPVTYYSKKLSCAQKN